MHVEKNDSVECNARMDHLHAQTEVSDEVLEKHDRGQFVILSIVDNRIEATKIVIGQLNIMDI